MSTEAVKLLNDRGLEASRLQKVFKTGININQNIVGKMYLSKGIIIIRMQRIFLGVQR